jgi:hypothetical protein
MGSKTETGIFTDRATDEVIALLRIMGAHLDKNCAQAFAIFWTATAVVVDYKRAGGFTDRLRLSPERIADTLGSNFHRVIAQLPRR